MEENRVKIIRDELGGISQSKLAEITGIPLYKIRDAEAGKTKISPEIAEALEEKFNFSFKWIITGKGERRWAGHKNILKEPGETYTSSGGRMVGVYALAGAGAPTDLVGIEPLEQIPIPNNFYRASIVTIKVRGKSMEPLIRDSAYVGIDREDKWIVSGEIYAVWLPHEGAVIKRIYLDMEKITLKSDNAQFPDILVSLQGIDDNFIQGRVRWVIQML